MTYTRPTSSYKQTYHESKTQNVHNHKPYHTGIATISPSRSLRIPHSKQQLQCRAQPTFAREMGLSPLPGSHCPSACRLATTLRSRCSTSMKSFSSVTVRGMRQPGPDTTAGKSESLAALQDRSCIHAGIQPLQIAQVLTIR